MTNNNVFNPIPPQPISGGFTYPSQTNMVPGISNQPINSIPSVPYASQPMLQRPVIPGRVVNDPSNITPQEVPMDGSVSLFPQTDYSKIYAKAWDSNGNLQTMIFVPEIPTTVQPDQNSSIINELMKKIEYIEKQVSHLKPYNPKYNRSKEEATNE